MNAPIEPKIPKQPEPEESKELTVTDDRFGKPWSKMDKGSKLNRLTQYIKLEKTERGFSDDDEKKLKIMLMQLCNSGALNKNTDVVYNPETKLIENIKNLTYNEDHTYSFKRPVKKHKTTPSKSKSNIDRHFSRSLK